MKRSQRRSAVRSQDTDVSKEGSKARHRQALTRQVPLRKKLAFAIPTALGALAILELALWVCGVKPAYLSRDPYAGFTPQVTHFQVEKINGDEEVVTVVPTKREVLNPQRFLRHKPAGTYRIVFLGGSATYGRPFYDLTSFPGWLRALLPKADPSRKWEVINAGAISYASYRIKGLMAELAAYEPDLFVIYTGENEFLERRTYAGVFGTPSLIRTAAGLASRLRLATVTQSGLELAGLIKPANSTRPTGIQEDVHRIPVDLVGPDAYTRNESFHDQVLTHYEASLNAMVDIAARAKARLLFVTPASNLRDFSPFKSENRAGLNPDQLGAWQAAYNRGLALTGNGQWEDADSAFNAALAIDDRHAGLLYWKGHVLLAEGRDAAAREYFTRARDEDICPMRALSATLETMRRVAARRQVALLDWEPVASSRAEHKIPGGDLLCDHVHLQSSASKMLALDLLDRLVEEKIVTLASGWGPQVIAEVANQIDSGIDRRRYAQELYNLSKLLELLGQPAEQSLKRVEEGLKLSGGDLEGFCLAGRFAGKLSRIEDATNYFHQALSKQPGAPCAEEGLGGLLLDQKKVREALPHLEAAVQSGPGSPVLLNKLGVAYAQLGHHDRAVPLFRRARQLNPTEPLILSNLAFSEERRGNAREAATLYRQALQLRPGDSQAQSGLRRLEGASDGGLRN